MTSDVATFLQSYKKTDELATSRMSISSALWRLKSEAEELWRVERFLENEENIYKLKRHMINLLDSFVELDKLARILYVKSILDNPDNLIHEHRSEALAQHIIQQAFKKRKFKEFFLALQESGNDHVYKHISEWIRKEVKNEVQETRVAAENQCSVGGTLCSTAFGTTDVKKKHHNTDAKSRKNRPETSCSPTSKLIGTYLLLPSSLATSSSIKHSQSNKKSSQTEPKVRKEGVEAADTVQVVSTVIRKAIVLWLAIVMAAFSVYFSFHWNPSTRVLYIMDGSLKLRPVLGGFNLTCTQGLNGVKHVIYNIKSGHIYYTTMSKSVAQLYRINEKRLECPDEPLREFRGDSFRISMAYDWIADRIYLAHYNKNTIEVCRRGATEGSCFEIIRSVPKAKVDGPDNLVVHSPEELLFWINTGGTSMSIGRSKLDGTDVKSFYKSAVLGHTVKYITALTTEMSQHPKLYYSLVDVQGESVIVSENFDMKSSKKILSRYAWISSLNVLDGQIYWLEDGQMRMTCAQGTCGVYKEKGIKSFAIYDSRQQPQSRENHCELDECSDLCVLSGKTSFTCLCPPLQKLGLDNRTCDWE